MGTRDGFLIWRVPAQHGTAALQCPVEVCGFFVNKQALDAACAAPGRSSASGDMRWVVATPAPAVVAGAFVAEWALRRFQTLWHTQPERLYRHARSAGDRVFEETGF